MSADPRLKINAAMSLVPARVPPSAWIGHLPFAFWLIEEARPRMLVELGSHHGTSYLGFCQAVKHCAVDTRCFAVDTWSGDEHSGLYGDGVFDVLRQYNERHYGGFSALMRMTFDDAQEYFADGTVDVLHIDGLHTYEAVKHDFESWLPKLSSRGVILFHDTMVRERHFGVWRLWAELIERYPGFEFQHTHGLGMLLVGEEQPQALLDLAAVRGTDREVAVLRLFDALGKRLHADGGADDVLRTRVAELEAELAILRGELDIALAHRLEALSRDLTAQWEHRVQAARDETAARWSQQVIAARGETAAELAHHVRALQAAIAADWSSRMDAAIAENAKVAAAAESSRTHFEDELAERDRRLQVHAVTIQSQAATIAERNARIAAIEASAEALESELAERDRLVQTHAATIQSQAAIIAERNARIAAIEASAEALESELAERDRLVQTHAATIQSQAAIIAERNARIAAIEASVEALESELAERNRLVQTHATTIQSQAAIIDERNGRIAAIEASTSWKLTGPARRLVMRLRGRGRSDQ